MTRGYVINGETLVSVRGMIGTSIETLTELGLAERNIEVIPKYVHKDLHVDDFGPEIPAEVLAMLAECRIVMTLVNYDNDILNTCLAESMGGGVAGTMAGAGIPLGAGKALFATGCHYISLNLSSPVLNKPWRFRASYMPMQPVEVPLGTSKTLARCVWRAIPYVLPNSNKELVSASAVVWDYTADDSGQ